MTRILVTGCHLKVDAGVLLGRSGLRNPTAVAWVTAEARVQSLAWELPYAMDAAIKNKLINESCCISE